jgi:hypothetical protein
MKHGSGTLVTLKGGITSVNINILMGKLIEIEQSIGVETNATVRKQVLDAQNYLLGIQKEIVEKLRREPRRAAFEPFPASRHAA